MRDVIIMSVQRVWEKIKLESLPLRVAEIFADDIVKSISDFNKGSGGPCPKCGKGMSAKYCRRCSFKETNILHKPCSCGSQFQVFKDDLNEDIWLFICNNEGACCEVISMRIKAETEDGAWLVWDDITLGTYSPVPKNIKESLGKAIDRAEQKMQAENVKPRVNCGPPTFSNDKDYDITYNSKLKECAKAMVDKLKLIEKDGRCGSIFVFAANHGCIYSGPNYKQELENLEEALKI
jgi:hypothetical protein